MRKTSPAVSAVKLCSSVWTFTVLGGWSDSRARVCVYDSFNVSVMKVGMSLNGWCVHVRLLLQGWWLCGVLKNPRRTRGRSFSEGQECRVISERTLACPPLSLALCLCRSVFRSGSAPQHVHALLYGSHAFFLDRLLMCWECSGAERRSYQMPHLQVLRIVSDSLKQHNSVMLCYTFKHITCVAGIEPVTSLVGNLLA